MVVFLPSRSQVVALEDRVRGAGAAPLREIRPRKLDVWQPWVPNFSHVDVHDDSWRRLRGHLDVEVGSEVSLTAGQKQRIALCRALVGNPALLLLDDVAATVNEDGFVSAFGRVPADNEDFVTLWHGPHTSLKLLTTSMAWPSLSMVVVLPWWRPDPSST